MSDVNVTVTVTDGPVQPRYILSKTFFAAAGFVLIMVAVFHLWLYVIGVAAALLLLWLLWRWGDRRWDRIKTARACRAEIIARADQQHAWVMQGNPRGTFGDGTRAMEHFWELTQCRHWPVEATLGRT